MGNTQSQPNRASSNNTKGNHGSAPVLDMDNMPFFGPPRAQGAQGAQGVDSFSKTPGIMRNSRISTVPNHLHLHHSNMPAPPCDNTMETSPILPSPSRSPDSIHTQWNPGHAKWPSYHIVEGSTAQNMCGEISATSPQIGVQSPRQSPSRSFSSSHSGSSITSQLSFLSQSCATSPQKHRSIMSLHQSSGSLEFVDEPIDANVPPPVPEHQMLPNSLQHRHQNQEVESALAAIDSLESEIEHDEGYLRSRSRSRGIYRSRTNSRSFSRPRSLSRTLSGDFSNNAEALQTPLTTDVYTRKCRYSTELSPPGLVKSGDQSETEEDEELHSPGHSFALDGYSEGNTRLRVVNLEASTGSQLLNGGDPTLSPPHQRTHQYRVKSKAMIAEETELRQRRRYARYGHTFRGTV